MRFRAFVFDDDEATRRFLRKLLERRGYEVIDFPEPGACQIYRDPECFCSRHDACGDILITDLNMPRVNGLDLIAEQTRKGCKGILRNKAVLSGAWTPEQMDRAAELGCKIFDKPLSIPDFERWLDRCERRIKPGRKLADLKTLQAELDS